MPRRSAVSQAAALLGRKGGKANTPAQQRARALPKGGGRPPSYRLTGGHLERRDGDRWLELDPPLDRPAREALRRLMHR